MKNTANIFRCLTLGLLLLPAAALAQDDPMPQWRNPTTFDTGNDECFWIARVGERVSQGYSTGSSVKSTCAAGSCPNIVGHASITSSSRNSGADGGITCCNHTNLWDANDRRFQFITSEEAGIDEFTKTDPVNKPNEGMSRIPEGYTSCIRLGDPRATGSCSSSATWSSGNNRGSEALFYTMHVTTENALLFINYAVVARCYNHTPNEAGEFLIRVVKQNANGTWPNAPINDNLWFRVSAPPIPSNGIPEKPWEVGRPCTSDISNCNCAASTCHYVYKPWAKVAISLSEFLYEDVRIELYTSDCIYNVDPIYAYVCGDYQPMVINTAGCPSLESDVLDTLSAPEGMLTYRWYVTKRAAAPKNKLLNKGYMDTVAFRQIFPLEGDTTYNRYCPTLADFVASEGAHAGDTLSSMTFKCVMTSALDPDKPFESTIYVNVENRKPIINYEWEDEWEASCTGQVTMHNKTIVYAASGIVDDSTHWVVYADTTGTVPLDTLWGDNVTYKFPHEGPYAVRLFCTTDATSEAGYCTAAKRFIVNAMETPPADFVLSSVELCEGETLAIEASDSVKAKGNSLKLTWKIDDVVQPDSTTSLQRVLEPGSHTITLVTLNADSCTYSTTQEVMVYGQPTIDLGSDIAAICPGDSVLLSADGTTEFTWNSTPYDPALDSAQGKSAFTVSPTETTVYYLLPSNNTPCKVDGAQVTIEVVPVPVPTIRSNTNQVNKEDARLILQDVSNDAAVSRWVFSDGGHSEGQRVTHTFGNLDEDSVWVQLISCNRLDCCADTTVWYPMIITTVWFPNVFTPDQDQNNTFGMITSLNLIEYELYIYNRNGQLVWQTTDPTEQWDGIMSNGNKAPVGTYAYFYRYAYSTDSFHQGHGSVTLLR